MQARKTNGTVGTMVKMVAAVAMAVGSLVAGSGCDEDYYWGTGSGFRSGQLNQSNEIPLDPADVESWFSGFSGGSNGGHSH